MKKLLLTLALTPALFTSGAFAQTVSEDVTKELWCGTALVVAFGAAPQGATSEQLAEAQTYIDGGNSLINDAAQKHLDAGFTQDQVTKAKADTVAEVTPVVTGDGSGAKYTFDDCAQLLPAVTGMDTGASSGMSSAASM